jgi:hypothetical protein
MQRAEASGWWLPAVFGVHATRACDTLQGAGVLISGMVFRLWQLRVVFRARIL